MRRRLRDSPTIVLLSVFGVVFVLQQLVLLVADLNLVLSLFALSTPVVRNPWTVLTNVVAHSGTSHLLGNAALFTVVGLLVERDTTRSRFCAFFFLTGVLSALSEVWFAALVGPHLAGLSPGTYVWGASGAVYALLGYLLTGNRLTERVVGSVQVDPRLQTAALVVLAVAMTVASAGPDVALVAHFTGLLLGLSAGRVHVLRPRGGVETPEPA